MVTVLVGAITTGTLVVLPAESFAVTANVPVVDPAVYSPVLLTVPPVADQVMEELALSLSVNCCVPPGGKLVDGGFTASVATVIFAAEVKICSVLASCACTSSKCTPFDKVTKVSKVLVLDWTVEATWSTHSFMYLAVAL
jgi:hypothetical protein